MTAAMLQAEQSANSTSEIRAPRGFVVALDAVSMRDVARVGGKNASLGELLERLAEPARVLRRQAGIDSVSVTADSFVRVKANVAGAERAR